MRSPINRRQFLQLMAAAASGAAITPWAHYLFAAADPDTLSTKAPFAWNFSATDPAEWVCQVPPRVKLSGTPDLELNLTAAPKQVAIFPGQMTNVFSYTGELVSGAAGRVQNIPGSYLGPIIRARQGEHVRIHFTNNLPQQTIVHWHGLHVPTIMDGHPQYGIPSGSSYTYDFEILNRAGTHWFHPHPHMLTASQVNQGLAGLFLVSDDDEEMAELPSGAYDIPLVIQDRSFDANNQFIYTGVGLYGFIGNTILVNGQANVIQPVFDQTYRLRILNGCNSRILKLAWSDGTPLTVIATDGGLLANPIQRDYVTLSSAERVDILVDFSQWAPGTEPVLKSLPFTGATPASGSLPNGAEFAVMTFHIAAAQHTYLPLIQQSGSQTTPSTPISLSTALSRFQRLDPADALNAGTPRPYSLYANGADWTINGRLFEMTGVAADEIFQLNTQEQLEFINIPPGGPGSNVEIAHPMHLHGPHFQVISRTPPTDPTQYNNWLTVKDGYTDEGWKDTILLMPGERVVIQMHFHEFTGLYLYHCHNLEHEDMGMMRNYRIDP